MPDAPDETKEAVSSMKHSTRKMVATRAKFVEESLIPKAGRMLEIAARMNKLSSSGKASVMFPSYRDCWSSCLNRHAEFV